MEPVITYQNPLVRDLAWALSSPPLLQRHDPGVRWLDTPWFVQISDRYRERLAQLDRDPRPLAEAVARQTDRRLGTYFECLWRFWLDDNPHYRLLYANLALRAQQRTIGEFDFLVQDLETGRILHWEIAIKFYLGSGATAQPNNWWGPARRDRLDIKTARLLEHQGKLSQHPAGQRLLQQLSLQVDETWLFIKGRLFYPSGANNAAPAGANPQHRRGFWIKQRELPALATSKWLQLERHQWLAPLAHTDTTACTDSAALVEKGPGKPLQRPVCIARIEDGVEVERGFIVADDWDQPA